MNGHFHLYTKQSIKKMLEYFQFKDITFYDKSGISKNEIMAKEVEDHGLSHSFIVEGVK